MVAYAIFIKEHEHDPAALEQYAATVRDTLAGRTVKMLSYYGETETLEGPEAQGVVILEFPTMDEARAWYRSDAYKKVRALRFQGADYRALLVQGS